MLCGYRERSSFYPAGDIVECGACGVLFVSPRPTAAAIERFYSASGHYDHWDREPGRAAMWERRVARVRRHVPSGRLLDVGSGQGDFGSVARRYFTVEGTEISAEGVRLAKERHGLDIHRGELLDLDLPRGAYDVVTIWHVLEHVPNPGAVLARSAELLRPGGVLVVAVPNTDVGFQVTRSVLRSALATTRGKPARRGVRIERLKLDRPEEEIHLTHFTLGTLTRAMGSVGLSVVERGVDDHSPHLGPLARGAHAFFTFQNAVVGACAAPCILAVGRRA